MKTPLKERAKPKAPPFDWSAMETAVAAARQARSLEFLQQQHPGTFTVKEFAARYNLKYENAVARLGNMRRQGIVEIAHRLPAVDALGHVTLVSLYRVIPHGKA